MRRSARLQGKPPPEPQPTKRKKAEPKPKTPRVKAEPKPKKTPKVKAEPKPKTPRVKAEPKTKKTKVKTEPKPEPEPKVKTELPPIIQEIIDIYDLKPDTAASTTSFEIQNTDDCTALIGKAKDAKKHQRIVSYPLLDSKGNIYKLCFLYDELLELIEKKDSDEFTPDMMREIESFYYQKSKQKISLSPKMSPVFINYIKNHKEIPPLLKPDDDKKPAHSLEVIVLDMFIHYFQANPEDLKSNNMFLIGKYYLKKLLVTPAQFLKWVLMNPIFSMLFVFCVKILKITFCLYTSLEDITPVIEAVKQFFDYQPLVTTTLEIAKSLYNCIINPTSKWNCFKTIAFGSGSVLSTYVSWVINKSTNVLSYTLEFLINKDEIRSMQTLIQIVKSPTALFTYVFYGEQKTLDNKAILGQLIYHCNSDFDFISMAVILSILPASFLSNITYTLIRIVTLYPDPEQLTVQALSEYDTLITASINRLSNKKFKSCLDVMFIIINTYKTKIDVFYKIWDMISSLFHDIIPCLFQIITRYITFAKKSDTPCCMASIVNDIKYVINNNFKPGGFLSDLFSSFSFDFDGKRKMSGKKKKLSGKRSLPRNQASLLKSKQRLLLLL